MNSVSSFNLINLLQLYTFVNETNAIFSLLIKIANQSKSQEIHTLQPHWS